ANSYQFIGYLSEAADPYELKLACMIGELISSKMDYVSTEQWTLYYQKLARDVGLMNGARIDHRGITNAVQRLWSDEWLNQQGLALCGENTWLLAMFRKHRRVFGYLQHFIVWLSLRGLSIDFFEEFNCATAIPKMVSHRVSTVAPLDIDKRDETRRKWLNILQSSEMLSLKNIRSTTLGSRLYTWLYRHDRNWLNSHKPIVLNNYQNKRVDWRVRDLLLVKKLIEIKNKADDRMEDPRHSKSWFASSIKQKSLIEKKLYKLPLCSSFFDRYSESIEEYQVRRLSRVMVQLIEHKDILRPTCEIERLAGLNRTRSRKPAREILRLDIPAWQRAAALP
ncbi:MAG: transcriptional antiterminator, partial [Aliivibrio sp.]|uniref:TnsD family Tn7-like transposition protein n=1 Tax=Aliivibrio sp. TaxID=1872443 RepID=UPI001A3FA9F1|nr:transcriptional antiterminator [Aliivibrio sp.]